MQRMGGENDLNTQLPANAARAALRRIGRQDTEVRLIRLGSTVLFRTIDGELVLRVGGDPIEMSRNLRIAEALHEAGVPSLRPMIDEPLDVGGWCVTLWPLIEGGSSPTSHWLGRTARLLHDSVASVRESLADRDVVLKGFVHEEMRKVRRRLDQADRAGVYSSESLSTLLSVLEEIELGLEASSDDHVVVHGDLYPGNTVSDRQCTLLIDFDMVSLGPRAADVAPEMVRERRFPGSGASYRSFIEGYGHEVAPPSVLELLASLRELTMVSWIAALALRRPDVVDEARHRIRTIAAQARTEPWTAA